MNNIETYINSRFKMIEDILNMHINNCEPHRDNYKINLNLQPIEINETIMPIRQENAKIKAEELLTDPNNRLLSDLEIDEFKGKVGKLEMQESIDNASKEIKVLLAKQIDNLLNSKDIMNGIANLLSLLQNNQDAKDLMDELSNIANKNELACHINSGYHLTDDDRIALDQLLKFIKTGCADWDATEGEPNYIRNKPDKLPADGGNADTVGGLCAGKLINKQLDYRIFGVKGVDTYNNNQVNIIFGDQYKTDSLETLIKEGTTNALREGEYDIKSLNIPEQCTLHGTHASTICNSKIYLNDGSAIKDLSFYNCEIFITGSNVDILNNEFTSCSISILSTYCSIIKNNRCVDTNFTIKNMTDSIVTENILIASNGLKYLGGSNIITNNIYN